MILQKCPPIFILLGHIYTARYTDNVLCDINTQNICPRMKLYSEFETSKTCVLTSVNSVVIIGSSGVCVCVCVCVCVFLTEIVLVANY